MTRPGAAVENAIHQFHPRLSVNGICTRSQTLADDVGFWQRAGIGIVGIPLDKLSDAEWDSGLMSVRQSGFVVSNVVWGSAFRLDDENQWEEGRHALYRALDGAGRVEAHCLYITSGPAGRLTTDQAVAALGVAIDPVLARADEIGVPLAMEHNTPFSREYGCVHSLADMIETAEEIGVGICVDQANCWVERHVDALFRRGVHFFRLVQVSDYVVGTPEARNRAVPGDGDIPLEWLIGELLEAGYTGWFDIELLGPRIEAEGAQAAVIRAADHMSSLLSRLGA